MQQKAFMQYSININQLAIVNHNNHFGTNLDIIDGVILEYLQKQSTSTFAKRNFKIVDGAVFYLLCYDNIIQQLPLIKIASKDAICRRIDKLLNANVILKHIEKIPNNGTKIYFTTTEIFESFFSYDTTQKSDGDTTQKSDGDTTQKSDGDTTQKSDELTYDKNINDKNINDNKATAGGLVSNVSSVKESLTAQKPKQEVDFPQEFVEFYEGYEGKHPSKQKARASKVLSKWRNACKTRTNAEILLAVEFYAKYIELTKQTWKNGIGQQKKKLEFWLTSDYELDWEEKYNEEQRKQQKSTFNNQNAKPKPDHFSIDKKYAGTKNDDFFDGYINGK